MKSKLISRCGLNGCGFLIYRLSIKWSGELISIFMSEDDSTFKPLSVNIIAKFLKKSLYYSPWFFSKKWLRNHPKFVLHFLIHIDVLMLCSKFELIPTSIFRVIAILRNSQIFEKIPVL